MKFEIACATVDPQTDSFDPSPLIPYVQSLGITYHYLSEPIVELAKSKLQGDSLCAFCSRFKRGLLYSCCRYVLHFKHVEKFARSLFYLTLFLLFFLCPERTSTTSWCWRSTWTISWKVSSCLLSTTDRFIAFYIIGEYVADTSSAFDSFQMFCSPKNDLILTGSYHESELQDRGR